MIETSHLNWQFAQTGVQTSLDRMTMHCAQEFGCSVALISLLDAANQFFVAKFGTGLTGSPREISFCRHVVESGQPLLVTDTHHDERFSDNPLVTGSPFIRSYAGCPITRSDGEMIGTLCLIDERPGTFTANTFTFLQRYALGVSDLVRLHETSLEAANLVRQVQEQNDQLSTANRVFRHAEKVARIGSWEVDIGSGGLYWSEGVYRIHGIEPGSHITLDEAIEFFTEADRNLVRLHVERALQDRVPFEFEATLQVPNGSYRTVHCTGEHLPGDAEHPPRLVGVVRDCSAQYEAQSALEYAASHDSLTRLLNRRSLDHFLQQRLNAADADGEGVILLILDLDGFKDVNDTFGHLAGDMVLEEIANRVRSADLDSSLIARWGGDEFVIILPEGTTVERGVAYGHTVLEQIRQETDIGGRHIALNATCGLAQSEKQITTRELIRRADTALYNGKKRNPGSVNVYDAAMERANQHRQRAIREVKSALRGNRLFAGYQPVVDLRSGKYVGFEALLRLNSADQQRLTATEVMPALLDPAISKQVSGQMMEFVASEVAQLFKHYRDVRFVSLNATEGDLLWPQFASTFLNTFRHKKADLSRITLEVTETMLLVNDADAVREVLNELSEAGVKIALDDFGTGFSSLSHLRDFPIDKVKIDGSFVQSMTGEHGSRLIVQAIIGMAKSLGIEVVAEGIETENQRRMLVEMGCAIGQGFLFSPALELGLLCHRKAGATRSRKLAQGRFDKLNRSAVAA